MGVTFDQLTARLRNVKTSPGGITARCPVHEDQHNSLSVSRGQDGLLLHCHAGCRTEAVCEAMGIRMADLFFAPRNGHPTNGTATLQPRSLTLSEFGRAKGLDVEFLKAHGVSEERNALVFHYLLMDGQRAPRQRIRSSLTGDRGFCWNKAEGRPVPYGLWRIREARQHGAAELVLVEGESDALTCWAHKLTALGLPGADNCSLLQAPHVAGFRRILICRENDHGGEIFEKGCVGRLAALEFAGEVLVVEMARAGVKDINDLHVKLRNEPGGFESEWEALKLTARMVELPIVGLETLHAASVQPTRVVWVWRNRIPAAKLTLFAGGPGIGKSFVTTDIAARVSTGRSWPDGSEGFLARTLIFSAEDSPSDTIVPRLKALCADLQMIQIAKRVREANESGEIVRRAFSLARDLPHVEKLLDKDPETKLLIVDPVSAYMGRTDSHKNAEVRTEILDPLAELAERRGIAVIAVSHFTKGGNGNSLERVSGSIAFPAAARTVWGFAKDPEDSARRLMLFGKSNVGPEVPGLAFRIAANESGDTTLQWLQGDVSERLDDVLREQAEQQRETGGRKLELAKTLLRDLLSNGPRPNDEIEEKAREMGVSEMTLRRARWDLGVKMTRTGFGKGFSASLPVFANHNHREAN